MPLLDYGCVVWGDCSKKDAQRLERLQNQAMRVILSANRKTWTQCMRTKLVILSLYNRRRFLELQFVFKVVNKINCPYQLDNYLVMKSELHSRNLRDNTRVLDVIATKIKIGQSTFKSSAARGWNALPKQLREIKTLPLFKAKLLEYFLELDVLQHVCSAS